jgi:phosphoribosylanthranilate isomerase
MTRVKICGITNLEDALVAADAGADAVGFIFAESPRRVSVAQAASICRQLPPFVARVGVFVNAPTEEIRAVAAEVGLTAIQLSGDEPPEDAAALAPIPVLKAFRVRDEAVLERLAEYAVHAVLLDGYAPALYGGTGVRVPVAIAHSAAERGLRVVVAGGLDPDNVAEVVSAARPYGVDVGSGVEAHPGRKDSASIRAFIAAVREADGRPS